MSFTANITLNFNAAAAINGFQSVSTAVQKAQQAAAASTSSFQAQANSVKTATAAVQSAITVYNSYGVAVQRATQSGSSLSGALSQLSSSASSSQGALRGMEATISNSATTSNSANSAIKFLNTSMTSSGTASAAAGTKFNAMGQAISTNVDAAQKTSTSFGSLNNVMGQTSQATEKTATSTQKMGVNFGNAVGFMGAAIGSGVQLFETFESLERAQVGVDRAQNALSTSQLKETSLQNQLNKLTADGQQGTAAYALVQEKLALQHEKTTTAADRLQLKQNDLNVTYADFAKNIIPQVVSVGGTMIGALANMGINTQGLKDKFVQLIPSLTGGATGLRGFGAALTSIALNPFTIALVALSVALLAYKTNAFGFRDATDAVGKSVGDVNPVFRLLGDSLKATGMMFGLVSGNADQMRDDLHKDVTDVGNSWNVFLVILQRGIDVAAEMVSNFFSPITGGFSQLSAALDPAAAAIEGFFSNLSASLDPAAAAVEAAMTQIGTAIEGFFRQALAARDEIDKWLDDNIVQPIIKGIQAIPAKLTSAAIDLVSVVWEALKKASRVITDAIDWLQTNIVTPITSAILSIPSRLTSGFVDLVAIIWTGLKGASKAVTDAPAWLFTNIITPIVNAVKTTPATIATAMGRFDLGKTIWDTLIKGSSDLGGIIQKWLSDSIVLPFAKSLDALAKAFPQAASVINPIISKLWEGINSLSGAQVQNAQAAKQQGVSYNELGGHVQFVSDTVDTANGLIGENGDIVKGNTEATDQLTAAQAKASTTISKNLTAVAGLSKEYASVIKFETGFKDSLTEEDLAANKTLATYNQMGAELRKLQDSNKTTGIEVAALSNLMKESTFVQELQTKGVQEQQKALLSTEQETAVMQGKLQELNSELSTGEAQWVSYQNGLAKANLEFAQNEQKIAAAQGELQSLNDHLRDGTATWQAYRQGIVDGNIEYDKFITSSVQAAAKTQQLTTDLQAAANVYKGFPDFIEPTIQNLEAFVKAGLSISGVMKDGGAAVEEFAKIAQKSFDDLTAAGQDFFKKLVDASGKGGTDAVDAWKKAFDELPPAVAATLDESEREALASASQFAQAGKQAGEAFALNIMAGQAAHKPWDQTVADAKQAVTDIISQVGSLTPEMSAKVDEFFARLSTAPTEKIPELIAEFSKIPGPVGEIFTQMAQTAQDRGFTPLTTGAQTASTDTKTALTDIPTAAQTFFTISEIYLTVLDAMGADTVKISAQIGAAFAGIATNAGPEFVKLGDAYLTTLDAMGSDTVTVAAKIGAAFNGIVGPANAAFSRVQSDVTGYLNSILRIAQNTFNAIANSANAVVGPISSAFSKAQSAATSAFNTISSNAKNAFAAVSSAADSAASRVSSAMSKIASSANQATNSVKQLAAAINALKDKTVTITTVYRTVYQGFQHGGLIAAASGGGGGQGAFITNRQQKYRGHTIGEAGKPELVLPLSANTGDLADKSINLGAVLKRFRGGAGGGAKDKTDKESEDSKATKVAFITPPPAAPRGAGAGGTGGEKRDLTIKGKFQNDIPLQINIDGKRLLTMVQRQLLEFSDASV